VQNKQSLLKCFGQVYYLQVKPEPTQVAYLTAHVGTSTYSIKKIAMHEFLAYFVPVSEMRISFMMLTPELFRCPKLMVGRARVVPIW
jgi:hypothetical protein